MKEVVRSYIKVYEPDQLTLRACAACLVGFACNDLAWALDPMPEGVSFTTHHCPSRPPSPTQPGTVPRCTWQEACADPQRHGIRGTETRWSCWCSRSSHPTGKPGTPFSSWNRPTSWKTRNWMQPRTDSTEPGSSPCRTCLDTYCRTRSRR